MKDLHSFRNLAIMLVGMVLLSGCGKTDGSSKKTTSRKSAIETTASETKSDVAGKVNEIEVPLPEGVLAKVGSWTLTLEEFNRRIEGVKQIVKDFDETKPGARATVLDELIRQQLMVNEGRRLQVEQKGEIQEAVRDFENTLIVQELAGQLVKEIAVSEQEARDYYEANPDMFLNPVEKQFREIVLPSETEAKEVYVQVLQGGDFVQLARERSKGKTAANGGDLGFLVQAPFEQMQKETEVLKKGEVTRVFGGPDGFYIVKLDALRGGEKQSFEEIKEELVRYMTAQKQQEALMIRLQEVSQRVKVQVNPDLIGEDKK